jgi:hypothetical protein
MARTVLVFIHVTSAIGVFAALAIEGAVLQQIRRSLDSAQLRVALTGFRLVPHVAIPSLLTTILSGLYLTATVWAGARRGSMWRSSV